MRGAFTPASIGGVLYGDDAVAKTPIARFVRLASFCLRDEPLFARCLLHAFTAHILLLPKLSVLSRMRPSCSTHAKLQQFLRDAFLPKVFFALEQVDGACDLEVDGRVFLELLHYVCVNTGVRLRDVLGEQTFVELDTVWSTCAQKTVDYKVLVKRFPVLPASQPTVEGLLSDSPQTHISVLPFSHPVFDKVLSSIQLAIDEDGVDPSLEQDASDVPFQDEHHWHNHRRAILPKYLGGDSTHAQQTEWQRKRRLRNEQRFMAKMQWQAESLTGASGKALQRITIVSGKKDSSVGKSRGPDSINVRRVFLIVTMGVDDEPRLPHLKDSTARGKEKKPLVKKADAIRQQIAKQKMADQNISNASWWSEQLAVMKNLPLDQKYEFLDRLMNNGRTEDGWLAVDIRLFGIHLEFLRWIEDSNGDKKDEDRQAEVRDRYTVSIMRRVKDLYERGSLFAAALNALDTVLQTLGFKSYEPGFRASSPNGIEDERPLSFKFVKLLRSKTKAPAHKYMRITEEPVVWQMRLFGEFMDRSMDSQPDRRVSFMPDAWQRKVLDCLDQNHSVLVVGK